MEYSDSDNLDAYLRKELSSEEQQKLEKEIAENEELAQELKRQEMVLEHIELIEDRRMAEQVKAIHLQEMKRRRQGGRIRSIRQWAAAAAVVLLLSIAGWWLWPTSNSPEQLFAQHYEAYDLTFGNRSEGDPLVLAGSSYLANDYEAAAVAFESILQDDPTQSKARFALGICHMELKQWGNAVQSFEQLVKGQDALYADNARWYWALALLKLDRAEEAASQLEILSTTNGARFQEQAIQLLKAIK